MHKKWSLQDIKDVINEIGDKLQYHCNLPIEISKRAKKRLGAFFFKKEGNKICGVKFVFSEILINGTFPEKVVKDVIIHEYLHYYCDTKTGKNNGHNKFFKEMCIKNNIIPSATLKNLEVINKEKEKYRYYIYCQMCGKLVCVHKRVDAAKRKTQKYISSCCKSKLIIR